MQHSAINATLLYSYLLVHVCRSDENLIFTSGNWDS